MEVNMFTVSPASEFARECFKELMEDGQSHSFKEITDYVIRQSKEKRFLAEYTTGKIWMAITQLTKKPDSEYTRIGYGVYKKCGQEMAITEPSQSSWEHLLDKSVELQELLSEGFSPMEPLPDMTPDEMYNYNVISKNVASDIDRVIEGIAALLAQMEDHEHALSRDHTQELSINM